MSIKKVQTIQDQFSQSSQISNNPQKNMAKNYSVISFENRIQLIQQVCIKKQQIIRVAPSLGIKLSTAKYILRSFRKNGKVLKKVQEFNANLKESYEKLISLKVKIKEINKIKSLNKKKNDAKKKKKELNPSIDLQGQLITNQAQKILENQKNDEKAGFDFSTSQIQNAETSIKTQQNNDQNHPKFALFYFYNPLWATVTPIEYLYH